MLLKSTKVWQNGQFVPLIIEVENGKIVHIYDYEVNKEVEYDLKDNMVLPGFIDIHTHGAYGFDTNDAEEEGLRRWAKNIGEEGVTSFLPTTITQTEEVLTKAVANVAKVIKEGYEGAEILGIHFEGPYLEKEKRGAQPLNCIVPASVEQFKRFQDASDDNIKIVTLACELDEDYKLTKYLASQGIVPSLGHSGASYKDTLLAFANGAKSQTHTYNAMTPFTHREVGQVGFGFFANDNFGEIICDGIHSTREALKVFFDAKGKDHAVVISDSINAKGLGQGEYIFGGEKVIVNNKGEAVREDGRLAGSVAKINESFKLLVTEALVPFASVVNATSKNPATLLNVVDRKGLIKVGYDADFAIMDNNYDIKMTISNGKLTYERAK